MNDLIIGKHGVYQAKDVHFTTHCEYCENQKAYHYFLQICIGDKVLEDFAFEKDFKDQVLATIGNAFYYHLTCTSSFGGIWDLAKWFNDLMIKFKKEPHK